MKPEPDIIYQLLQQYLQPDKDFIWGFADLRGLINEKFGDFTYGISIGKRLDPGIIAKVVNGPTLDYYNHYRELNNELSRISHRVSDCLNDAGISTLNITPYSDWSRFSHLTL